MPTADSHDVVIVGGGIAGSALATVLARNGLDVLVLERQTEFRDKVRGEVMLPWGVAEILRLDLEKTLLDAGGGYATHFVFYDEVFDPSEAEATALPVDQLLPGVPGCLDVGHPQACEALIYSAATAGATIIRGLLLFPWVSCHDLPGSSGQHPPRVRVAMAINASGLW